MIKDNKLPSIAYFCMEYGLKSDFKIYAGGLGILAGDYLKGAKDLNMPIIGIGIKWKMGYGDQYINNRNIYDAYYNYKYDFLEDTNITVNIRIRNRDVACKVWKVDRFGNNPLYLLDTDVEENTSEDRWITGQLYGWFKEERIAQEMVLGIGGVKLLRKLGVNVDIYHFNEGHAVLAALELIREKIDEGFTFEKAWKSIREKIVFTTHTPIEQGNESHDLDTLEYMGAFNGLKRKEIIKIGGDPFNMTVAALRLSKISNGVSALHGETAKKMWQHISDKSEIISITNAIHIPSWADPRIIKAYKDNISLYNVHMKNKEELIRFIEDKNGVHLDINKLLIGFSRRAAPYKRSDLIFTDKHFLESLLSTGKIQLVFSGKAHPLDDKGKEIILNLINMSNQYPNSVVFLQNYDMDIGARLTKGADIWLNNPRRPLEACGTSGMKAAVNGVLNCSILDGWWAEACNHGVNGWQFGDGLGLDELGEKELDYHDCKCLYEVLLNSVIPMFYNDKDKWENMMRESVKTAIESFSMDRMIAEYYQKIYTK